MRAFLFKLAVFVSSFVLVAAGGGTDICGECRGVLNIPSFYNPGKYSSVGNINECLCLSTLPNYISSNSLTISAISIGGRDAVTSALTAMIKSGNHGTCNYPQHSQPQCQFGNPCGFTCKDGYSPYPYGSHPTDCVCPKPYTVCNGQCGLYKGCPSAHYSKRELAGSRGLKCPKGLTACSIPGRGADSFECVNTLNDLESCGGCMVPSFLSYSDHDGLDCTAIDGVSDVACVSGKCLIHKCMPGYSLNKTGDCVLDEGYYNYESDILVSQD
ncbi:hypothetical protein GALMADRAFT_125876, partial [Galerina marginata CBS 339.88]